MIAQVGVAVLATSTSSFSNNTNYAVVGTFNTSTGAYAFYSLAGGTYSSAGSGTASAPTLGAAMDAIAIGNGGTYLAGSSPEMAFYNGIWTTGNISTIATYTYCQYGF